MRDHGGGRIQVGIPPKGNLYKTGQLTCYAIGDDGDRQKGIAQRYQINTTEQFSGTVNVDSPHYAAATIAFVEATDKITDSANGLVTVLTGDTIRIRGSTGHDTVYTVKTGGVAEEIVTNEDITADEAAGAYITICKRATHSNNTVIDLNSRRKLEWARYVQTGKIGPASDGKLNWYNTATCFTLHPAAADLAMVAGNILRIEGSDESSRYFAGAVLVCSGFASAVNNLPGLVVSSVSFAGGNTDIIVNSGNQTLIAEVAAGARTIKIICQNTYAYCASANTALLGGYGDWRVANIKELLSLADLEVAGSKPNTTAFPTIPNSIISSSTEIDVTTNAFVAWDGAAALSYANAKTGNFRCMLVRGGG